MKTLGKWFIILLVVSLFVVACSSGAEETTDTPTDTETEADAPADTTEEEAETDRKSVV